MGKDGVASRRLRAQGVLIVEQGGRGGVADYSACLAAALGAQGVPVTLATAADHLYEPAAGVTVEPVFAYVRGHSRAARLARRAHISKLVNGLRFLWSVPQLARLSRHSAVAHVQGWESNSLGVVATAVMRIAGARIVYTAHNTFERRRFSLDGARVFPRLARSTIVHTQADRMAIRGAVSVVPHGHYGLVADAAPAVDSDDARAGLDIPSQRPVVLLFGVLRLDKGLNDLLDAALALPDWIVLVAGEEDGALEAAAPRLADPRLRGRVIVREGFQELAAVSRFFAAADVVALPYRRASQSGVLHLAYGFGRPVVAYPVGGMTEAVVHGETGWICAEASPAALAAQLRVAETEGRAQLQRRGEYAREWAERKFSWERIAQDTLAVYRRAIPE